MSGLKIGEIKGIKLRLDFSWFLIATLFIWSIQGFFRSQYPGLPSWHYWLMAGITVIFFFGSVIFHELAHSLVAIRNKIPVESITLFILGGLARIKKEAQSPGIEFRVAVAGPLSSLLLAGIFAGLGNVLGRADFHQGAVIFNYLAWINFLLAVFNLLPAFPLDGGRIFRSILWKILGNDIPATKIAVLAGRFFGWAMMAFGFGLFIVLGELDGLWLAFIGWFLEMAAAGSYEMFLIRKKLEGKKVIDGVRVRIIVADSAMVERFRAKNWICNSQDSLLDVWEKMRKNKSKRFFVEEKGAIIGEITLEDIDRIVKGESG